MHLTVYCPFLGSLLFGASTPALARRLPPATAARLLASGTLLAAAASSAAFGLLALTLLGRLPALAALGHWSPARLQSADPVPEAVGAIAVGVGGLLLLNVVRVGLLRARALLAARALCRELGAGHGQLVVVDDDIETMAVPAAGGRILASRARLAALSAPERRALLLHEGAHLADRHHLYRLAVDLAAALDPCQVPARSAVRYATERWADEAAAAGVGDRTTVARALAREGLRAAGTPSRAEDAPRSGGRVVPRVSALLAPAPRQRPGLLLVTAALVAGTLVATLHAQQDIEDVFEHSGVVPAVVAHPGMLVHAPLLVARSRVH